jgi:hypothetical protein
MGCVMDTKRAPAVRSGLHPDCHNQDPCLADASRREEGIDILPCGIDRPYAVRLRPYSEWVRGEVLLQCWGYETGTIATSDRGIGLSPGSPGAFHTLSYLGIV